MYHSLNFDEVFCWKHQEKKTSGFTSVSQDLKSQAGGQKLLCADSPKPDVWRLKKKRKRFLVWWILISAEGLRQQSHEHASTARTQPATCIPLYPPSDGCPLETSAIHRTYAKQRDDNLLYLFIEFFYIWFLIFKRHSTNMINLWLLHVFNNSYFFSQIPHFCVVFLTFCRVSRYRFLHDSQWTVLG